MVLEFHTCRGGGDVVTLSTAPMIVVERRHLVAVIMCDFVTSSRRCADAVSDKR